MTVSENECSVLRRVTMNGGVDRWADDFRLEAFYFINSHEAGVGNSSAGDDSEAPSLEKYPFGRAQKCMYVVH